MGRAAALKTTSQTEMQCHSKQTEPSIDRARGKNRSPKEAPVCNNVHSRLITDRLNFQLAARAAEYETFSTCAPRRAKLRRDEVVDDGRSIRGGVAAERRDIRASRRLIALDAFCAPGSIWRGMDASGHARKGNER